MDLEHFREICLDICYLNPDKPLLVGVSGGADSLTLLDALARLGFNLIAAYFDHRLRPESMDDARHVQEAAERLGAAYVLGTQDVAEYARQEKRSIEDAARRLRYRFLFDQARRAGAQAVAVGHTADDQVETVLMHLVRGSGLSGLTGMPYRAFLPVWDPDIPLVRPLLAFWRTEILNYCRERGLDPVTDATNQDPVFFRNRLRHELIPILETYNPQVRQAVWRMAQALAGDEAVVQSAVAQVWKACFAGQGAGYVSLLVEPLRDLLPGLQRRVLRQAAGLLLPDLRELDFDALERALRFIQRPDTTAQMDFASGLCLYLDEDLLLIAVGDSLPEVLDWPQLDRCEAQIVPVPGKLVLANGWVLESEWVEGDRFPRFFERSGIDTGLASTLHAWLDADSLPDGRLQLRCPVPGDRFRPLGLKGHSIKLSDFWINEKLPRRARAAYPLVTFGDEILWVPGFRPAEAYRINESTRKTLHLHLSRVPDRQ